MSTRLKNVTRTNESQKCVSLMVPQNSRLHMFTTAAENC